MLLTIGIIFKNHADEAAGKLNRYLTPSFRNLKDNRNIAELAVIELQILYQ